MNACLLPGLSLPTSSPQPKEFTISLEIASSTSRNASAIEVVTANRPKDQWSKFATVHVGTSEQDSRTSAVEQGKLYF